MTGKIINKILNVAWIGQGDFGDEAMAYALRKYLQSKGVESITYYHHGQYPSYQGENDLAIKKLHTFNVRGFKKKIIDYIKLRSFSSLIIGGGSILHSFNSIKWKLNLIKKMERFTHHKIHSAVVGVSLGPFKNSSDEKVCQDFLDHIGLAIFRDDYSYQLAKKLTQNKNLFSSLDTSVYLANQFPGDFANPNRPEDTVGLMFVLNKNKQEFFDKEKHFDKYLKVLNHLLDKNQKVILFTFYLGHDYSDIKLNHKLKKFCQNPDNVELFSFDGDIFATIKKMKQCGYIISMRLHGIIFAYLLRIPFISLAYDRKNDNFCRSVNYPSQMSFSSDHLNDIQPLINSIDTLLASGQSVYRNVMPVVKASKKVLDNFEKLSKLIQAKL